MHEPAVLILDEPTVGLDPHQVVEIRALIRDLRGRTTVLLSTHILSEVSSVCDRVVIIDRGRVVAQDSAADLARAQQRGERTLLRVEGGKKFRSTRRPRPISRHTTSGAPFDQSATRTADGCTEAVEWYELVPPSKVVTPRSNGLCGSRIAPSVKRTPDTKVAGLMSP